MQTQVDKVKKDIGKYASEKKAKFLSGYFKTGVGEYAQGDIFMGLTVPLSRKIALKYTGLTLGEINILLNSKIHEERQIALMILSNKTLKADELELKKLHKFYLKNLKNINNWDLVDGSAENLVGKYLNEKNKSLLTKLAKSKNIWARRIAIITTFYFIKKGKFNETLRLAKILLRDKHDLIHKAVGWMLREVGKRNISTEEKFLKKYYKVMPRTMLRYAIERFPENLRQSYLHAKI